MEDSALLAHSPVPLASNPNRAALPVTFMGTVPWAADMGWPMAGVAARGASAAAPASAEAGPWSSPPPEQAATWSTQTGAAIGYDVS